METLDPFYSPEEEQRALQQAAANNLTRNLLRSRRASETQPVDAQKAEKSDEFIKLGDDTNEGNALAGASEGKVPWMPKNGYPPYRNCFLRLHQEILDFVRWVSLSESEQKARDSFLARLNGVCKDIWPHSKVVPFGSFYTDLSLPSSDVDISVVNIPPERCDEAVSSEVISLRKLANELLHQQQVSFVELRETAKIPILRLRDIYPPHCEFDINVNPISSESPQATSNFVIKNAVEVYSGTFRPLVMTLKCFLNQRNLADTFTGGVGSYLLSCLVLGFLQQHQITSSDRAKELTSLGHLLFDFFNFYAREFRVDREGLSVRRSGSKFLKSSRHFEQNRIGSGKRMLTTQDSLCVESPLEPHVDIGNKVFQWKVVRSAFMQARQYLIDEVQHYDPENAFKSLLSPSLINPIHDMFIRHVEKDSEVTCPLSNLSGELQFKSKSIPVPPSPYTDDDDLRVVTIEDSDIEEPHRQQHRRYSHEENHRRNDYYTRDNRGHRDEEHFRGRKSYDNRNDNRFYRKRGRNQY